jgi:hypothetical protein
VLLHFRSRCWCAYAEKSNGGLWHVGAVDTSRGWKGRSCVPLNSYAAALSCRVHVIRTALDLLPPLPTSEDSGSLFWSNLRTCVVRDCSCGVRKAVCDIRNTTLVQPSGMASATSCVMSSGESCTSTVIEQQHTPPLPPSPATVEFEYG